MGRLPRFRGFHFECGYVQTLNSPCCPITPPGHQCSPVDHWSPSPPTYADKANQVLLHSATVHPPRFSRNCHIGCYDRSWESSLPLLSQRRKLSKRAASRSAPRYLSPGVRRKRSAKSMSFQTNHSNPPDSFL